jgi:lipopolysaccharide/colanic/teichoic acid biosynthesis glycosyltransferase
MRRRVKRVFDLLVVLPAVVLAAPLIVAIAAAIRLQLGKPVMFRQLRPGKDGRPFTLLKFRTMTAACDDRGTLLSDAQRITRLGGFLRSTSLDELPQLWNVVRGDMSLVGPRPLLMEYLLRYTQQQARRHQVLPGITGWAQVNGRNALSWEEKFELDTWYVDHWSLALDMAILWRTAWRVITREGISQEGHATMEEFRGSTRCSE